MIARIRARQQCDDTGAALLIALGFVALFGLMIGAILGFSDTSLRATETVQTQRENVYAADGAVEATIAAMRNDANMGRFGGAACDQTVPDLNGHSVVVTCTAHTNSGVGGGIGGTGDAIITKSGSEFGIYRDANGSLPVGGNIRSNSTILLGGGATIAATGDVSAPGACDAGVTAGPGKTRDCGAGTITSVPSYTPASGTGTATHTPCLAQGTVVKFEPGTYNSAAALNNLMSTGSPCAQSLFYFKPGVYTFNFPVGDDEWLINDANLNILGGAPLGFTLPSDALAPTTLKATLLGFTFPGACDEAQQGVQFIFTGTSRMNSTAGTTELCGRWNGSDPPISVYGSTNVLQSATLTPTGFTTPTAFTNVNPGAFTIGDGGTAKTVPTLGRNVTGAVTLTGFAQTTIPAGSAIQSVGVRVAHREGNGGSGSGNNDDFGSGTVTLVSGSGTCSDSLTKKLNLATETLNGLNGCLSSASSFSNIKVTYSVTAKNANNNNKLDDFLDGVAIDVTYANNGLAPASGCITNPGYSTSGADATHCPVFRITGGNNSHMAMHGMLYAPEGVVDMNASAGSMQGYTRGIVARNLRANITPSITFPFNISTPAPVGGVPTDRIVDLVATIDGVVKLQATVSFHDQPAAGTSVTIESWKVVR